VAEIIMMLQDYFQGVFQSLVGKKIVRITHGGEQGPYEIVAADFDGITYKISEDVTPTVNLRSSAALRLYRIVD
jgi:hypothetical protein